jgi:hypothetical protein
LGADKGYDAAAFVADMRALNVTPHIAQNVSGRRSAIDARTTRHPGYVVSQQKRKRIEEPFGWGKTIGGLARPMLPRCPKARLQVHSNNGRIQSHPPAKAYRGHSMTARPNTKPFEKPSRIFDRHRRTGLQSPIPFRKAQISAAC